MVAVLETETISFRANPIVPSPIQQTRLRTGAQLFQQRWATLKAGQTYSQLPSHSFEIQWRREHRPIRF
ncbi:MAG: hypothetical protein AAGD25_10730 [Cyanobacteria bacterium P01_F01_bin.150]